jgi:hypothetical protein
MGGINRRIQMEPRLVLTPQEEKEISEMTNPESMKAKFREYAENRGLIFRDAFDSNVIHEVENYPEQSAKLARSVLINGRETLVSADSPLELERKVGDAYRCAQAACEEELETTQQTIAAEPTAEEIQAAVDLELKFKRGEISASQYIEQSGAVKDYLEDQGIAMTDLQEVAQQKQGERLQQSWSSAVEEFLNSPEGSAWPGGPNLQVIQNLLSANHLEDAEDKVGALKACFAYMTENGMVQENKELTTRTRLEDATSVDEIREILGRPQYNSIYGNR